MSSTASGDLYPAQSDGDPRSSVRSGCPVTTMTATIAGQDSWRVQENEARRPQPLAYVSEVSRIGAHEEFHGDQEQQGDAAGQLRVPPSKMLRSASPAAEDRECQDNTKVWESLEITPANSGITRRESQEESAQSADGVHDDRQRREGGVKEGSVRNSAAPPRCSPCAMTSAMMSGWVVFFADAVELPGAVVIGDLPTRVPILT